ncbi:uncharacterized protein N7515_006736 [Penicillium bovifimosum]|uniref:Uncharacterized protein n=1 Tax=Penicillium bovifimosum TaxID=126998 RepID=A0A9W9L1I5_9EURO|nr:uncharacterized protein N7515_006736 [Penicillium bovifimosum]KAJ5130697.1 hypothetical protein N7515_006736 [Penicillium bovifimosum]
MSTPEQPAEPVVRECNILPLENVGRVDRIRNSRCQLGVMESELEYLRCVRDGLDEAKERDSITHEDFRWEIQPLLKSFRSSSATISGIILPLK